MRSSRGTTMGQRTYEANISILPAIGKAPSKKPYPPRLFLESFWNVRGSMSRGTWRRSRGAKCRSKKSAETESVYIGIQWLRLNCGFSRRAKMGEWGRAERENSSKRNPGFGSTALATNPLKKYGYILYHFLLVFKRSFLSLPRFLPSPRGRARARACSSAILSPSWRSHVACKSNVLFSWDVKTEFIKICAIKAIWREIAGRDAGITLTYQRGCHKIPNGQTIVLNYWSG